MRICSITNRLQTSFLKLGDFKWNLEMTLMVLHKYMIQFEFQKIKTSKVNDSVRENKKYRKTKLTISVLEFLVASINPFFPNVPFWKLCFFGKQRILEGNRLHKFSKLFLLFIITLILRVFWEAFGCWEHRGIQRRMQNLVNHLR